jgi:hypothetical protein
VNASGSCLKTLCQELVRVEGIDLVLQARVILLRLHRLYHLHCLLLPRVVWEVVAEVVAVVGGRAVGLRFQGSGIASEGCLCSVVRQGGLHGLSLVLSEYFQRYLRPRSWCVP